MSKQLGGQMTTQRQHPIIDDEKMYGLFRLLEHAKGEDKNGGNRLQHFLSIIKLTLSRYFIWVFVCVEGLVLLFLLWLLLTRSHQ